MLARATKKAASSVIRLPICGWLELTWRLRSACFAHWQFIGQAGSSKEGSSDKRARDCDRLMLVRERLARRLRAVPYWSGGHWRLAQVSMLLQDYECAYASAQAVLQLKPRTYCRAKAEQLLADLCQSAFKGT